MTTSKKTQYKKNKVDDVLSMANKIEVLKIGTADQAQVFYTIYLLNCELSLLNLLT